MQTNPVKAIREKCLDCCCGSSNEVKLCTIERCPLFAFRFGRNPYRPERSAAQIACAARLGELAKERKAAKQAEGR